MDLIAHYRLMAQYNRWMNERLYALAATMTDEERKRDLGAFFRSVHGTLNHLLLSDRIWLGRFAGEPERFQSRDHDGNLIPFRALSQELYADFVELRTERQRTDGDIEAYAASLRADVLEKSITYQAASHATRYEHPLFWALSHWFNHQTHHRGQATTLFKQLGRDPGVTDLLLMLREGG